MRKKLYRMTVLFLAFLMASCANPEPLLNEEDVSASAATSSEPREPVTYTLEAQEIPLSPELEDTWEWIVLDTREDQVLFAIQEKHSAEEEMYSYRLTREIGIYDVEQACVTAQWEPETPGWYQAGALTGEGTLVVPGPRTMSMFTHRNMFWSFWARIRKPSRTFPARCRSCGRWRMERQSPATWSRMDSLESVPFPMAR